MFRCQASRRHQAELDREPEEAGQRFEIDSTVTHGARP